MKLSDFDYPVAENLIAQQPLKERDSSRLFVLRRKNRSFEHRFFSDITDYLQKGDVLVINETKVISTRLSGTRPTGGYAEITLLKELQTNIWEALVKGVHEGEILLDNNISATVSRINGTAAKVCFNFSSHTYSKEVPDIKHLLEKMGTMPLPLYIKRKANVSDKDQYQTIYAKNKGAVAAPTAGLHFTEKLLENIKEKGIETRTVTLHVGYGTFRPVTAENITDHRMDEEFYDIPEATAIAVNSAKAENRKVIAVGTTVTRALESSLSDKSAGIVPGQRQASIFIYPGFRFRVIDALVTNFHLPRSTPMMLTSAFAGLDTLKRAYSEAIKKEYRLFSYGDAMLII